VKILLDENAPVDLLPVLRAAGHVAESVNFLGWKGLQNGDLLAKYRTPGRASSLIYATAKLTDKTSADASYGFRGRCLYQDRTMKRLTGLAVKV